MKKGNVSRINRNSGSVCSQPNRTTSNRSSPDTDLPFSSWLPDEPPTTGVQIVELNSSKSDHSTGNDEEKENYFNKDNWSYMNKQPNQEQDGYKINESAREGRRKNERNEAVGTTDMTDNTCQYDDDNAYGDVYVCRNIDQQNESGAYNHNVNCFTILDKHLAASDNSEEDYGNADLVEMEPNSEWNCDARTFAEVMAYNPDIPSETRTVWIYSFKNKRLLSENDFELLNIPSNDTIMSNASSMESFCEGKPELPAIERMPTPVPPVLVPRLHIPSTPPLPTLTEITEISEPKKQSSCNQTDNTQTVYQEKVRFKENNWCRSELDTPTEEKEFEKSKSVVNWMALSPREKRRRFRNTNPISVSQDLINQLRTLREENRFMSEAESKMKSTKCDGDQATKLQGQESLKEAKPRQNTNPFIDDSDELEELDDVPVEGNEQLSSRDKSQSKTYTYSEVQTDEFPSTSTSQRKSVLGSIIRSAKKSVRTLRRNTFVSKSADVTCDKDEMERNFWILKKSTSAVNIRIANDVTSTRRLRTNDDIEQYSSPGRGDHIQRLRRPRIRISARGNLSGRITDPLEKLGSDNWIQEESLINYNVSVPQDARGDGNALWIKNMSLLKPASWTEYLPITESVPSLHLSLNTESDQQAVSWFSRVASFFRCCK